MIHEKTNPNYYVAHPSPEIVEKFNNIYNELTKPELLIPRFMRDVVRFNVDDPLSLVLEEVKTKKYTNFPVYSSNGEFKGLLTDNGITNWLSYNVEDDHLLLSTIETSIGDVMSLEEEKNNFIFISRKKSIYDAKDIFEKYSNRIDAMLITENGEENEKLLGIITAWDILDNSH
ncbi:CBS domain-containing protein [Anaerobacillus sp. CMMVII]|uniref:CBS domain-containing protein n=1 Tax=Anaerobacillus sp. CMMVII TaxID=2755588 RepID=UPI0021B6FA78|nr:CBS domain-containing protein [Anaerobacillus sp. CMMVII]MCT8139955.1 CBS domain-containing protein [Anaerobacillus sp. CMMVII]